MQGKNQFAIGTYLTSQNSINADSAGRSRPNQDITFQPFTSAVMLTWIRPFATNFFNELRFQLHAVQLQYAVVEPECGLGNSAN